VLVLMLMGSYYLLRPVRDAMASDWTDAEVSFLWTLTFFLRALVVSVYGFAVSRVRFSALVPSVYTLFALSFVLFYVGTQTLAERDLLDKAFYVWVSLFSLFHVSVFWSFMADIFSKMQARRLFGFIGAGASTGALLGPLTVTVLVSDLGTDYLLLIAAAMVVAILPLIRALQRLKYSELHNQAVAVSPADLQSIGGSAFAGFEEFFKSSFLLGIGLFIFLYTSIGSFVYFALKNLLVDYDRAARAALYADIDLVVNTMTILVAAFATGRMAKHLGMPFTLASVPVLIAAGMAMLAAAPMVSIVVAVQIVRRIGNYAVSRPAREMLFTAVDREVRFKAKPVIDIVIYRGGDMLNAWAFTGLTQGLGLAMGPVALVGVGIASTWAAVGIYLGRRFNTLQPDSDETEPAVTAS
jgi:AAA family ATP:ADP antiporter